MRHTLLFTTVLLILVGCGNRPQSQSGASSTSVSASNVIEMTTSRAISGGRDSVDLGRIKEGDVIEYEVNVVNRDSVAMVLLDVSASCGCTMLDYDANPIITGDTARITLRYDSKGQSGSQLKTIRLYTSLTPRPYTILLMADVYQ
jgi:hypothetical protein